MFGKVKKGLMVLSVCALCANFAPAMADDFTVAVVDINKVVAESSQVKALKTEQQAKIQELEKWLKTVKEDVNKQQTKEGKEKLIKKYDADFAKKQEVIKKNYAEKLQAIDKNISGIIAKEAQIKGYKLVLPKGSVLYGGDDITSSITKLVK